MDSVKYHASSGPPSLRDWSKRVRLTLSDPNFVSGAININNLSNSSQGTSTNKDVSSGGRSSPVNMGRTYPSLLELKGLARRFGLKLMALRGGAIYLSTEAFYLELKENGDEILHILNPESIEVLPPGGDLVAHLQGLMELRPQDWKDLSRLSEELKSRIGKDFIPRLGGTPAQIRFSPHALPIGIRPKDDHFCLELKEDFPLAKEKVAELEKASGFPLGMKGGEEFLLDLIAPNSPLNTNLPDQRHRYYFAQHMLGVTLSSIQFRSASQIPEIISILKSQALYNALIASCGEGNSDVKSSSLLTFEVSSLNLNHISISFEHPVDEGITALEILLTAKALRTKLYYPSTSRVVQNECSDVVDQVLAKWPSIPLVMRMVIKFYETLGTSEEFFGRLEKKGDKNVGVASNNNAAISFDSSFTVDSLNAKGPQEVMCAPEASVLSNQKKTNLNNNTSTLKRKHFFDDQHLKPVVSITPVSEASSSSSGSTIMDKKIGIEIIPLGGSLSSSNKFGVKSSTSSNRDIKRSLSEDDKRASKVTSNASANRKDKKRKHSPINMDKAVKFPANLSKKQIKVSNSSPEGKKADKSSLMDSIKVTIKSSSKTLPKSAPGSPKLHSKVAKTTGKKHQRLLQEEQEEVKRLLTGGKLLNKTFQIPKISKDSESAFPTSSSSSELKKIPSLMSLTPPPLYSVKETSSKFSSPISSPRGRSSISPSTGSKRTSPSKNSEDVTIIDNF